MADFEISEIGTAKRLKAALSALDAVPLPLEGDTLRSHRARLEAWLRGPYKAAVHPNGQ